MGTENRAGRTCAAIRRALAEDWEPTRGREERGGSVYAIYRLLNLQSSHHEIVEHLWWLETVLLGRAGERLATELFAERLMRIPGEVEVFLRSGRS